MTHADLNSRGAKRLSTAMLDAGISPQVSSTRPLQERLEIKLTLSASFQARRLSKDEVSWIGRPANRRHCFSAQKNLDHVQRVPFYSHALPAPVQPGSIVARSILLRALVPPWPMMLMLPERLLFSYTLLRVVRTGWSSRLRVQHTFAWLLRATH